MSKKIVHELSDDDLIRLIQGTKVETVIKKVSDAARFIYDRTIRHGDDKITAQLVYYTYKQYKGDSTTIQSKATFLKDFNTYFPPLRNKDGTYYLLNAKPFDTSDETYWKMRKEMRHGKKQKSKKASGQS